MGNFDNEDGSERLYYELGDGRDRADERVLISCQMCVFRQTKDCAVAEDRLVENLGVDGGQSEEYSPRRIMLPGGNRPRRGWSGWSCQSFVGYVCSIY